MFDHTIYSNICKPVGILRVLLSIIITITVVSVWGANSLLGWFNNTLPFALWAIPATLCWLSAMMLINIALRLNPSLKNTLNKHRVLRICTFHLLPIMLAAMCAGFAAGVGQVFHVSLGAPIYTVSKWSWPAALLGAFISWCIVTWFHLYAKGQDPANNEAKLLELQARIRPHFLFNTLNSAMALVRLDPDAAESVLQNLAVLFRTALESGEGSMATIQEEVDLAKSYLSIEAIRLGDRLHVHWDLDESTLEMPIPQLSLQPLLENAIRHGIEPSSQVGEILVESSYHLGKINFTILNTIPAPNEKGRCTKGHGMALANLKARIALLYDFEGSLSTKIIQNEQQQYRFKVSLDVPIIK